MIKLVAASRLHPWVNPAPVVLKTKSVLNFGPQRQVALCVSVFLERPDYIANLVDQISGLSRTSNDADDVRGHSAQRIGYRFASHALGDQLFRLLAHNAKRWVCHATSLRLSGSP